MSGCNDAIHLVESSAQKIEVQPISGFRHYDL